MDFCGRVSTKVDKLSLGLRVAQTDIPYQDACLDIFDADMLHIVLEGLLRLGSFHQPS